MMIYDLLKRREEEGNPIRVAVVGCGAMGMGVAFQVGHTPGMKVVILADHDHSVINPAEAMLAKARFQGGVPTSSTTCLDLLQNGPDYDVLVECTTSIEEAADYCLTAISRNAHVVLMNAEVDIAFGPLLRHEAMKKGVVVTSDAGDQHGVIAQVVEQIGLWGFEPVQAGNIKGFLNRYATPQSIAGEAAKRRLNPVPCCAYTDGTKLNIEMALLCNAYGWKTKVRGMEGPACKRVEEALGLFDFDAYGGETVVDYILGAEPGGGIYVVARCDGGFDFQKPYMHYYKMGDGPYYLFYRPYHLCHLETPFAVARAVLRGVPLLQPWKGRQADVFAFAKRDVAKGEVIEHGIGGEHFYGMIEMQDVADREGLVPMWMLETEEKSPRPQTVEAVAKDAPLTLDAVRFPPTRLHALVEVQQKMG